ncbi:MAG TPA: hypothetical protein PLN13_14085 [Bacteroidia bacterium]|nr:hypothetical protein [Bacteroidia bacterium]HRH09707.1 hypothetical protein [Bacteroidia bacterium]
MAAVYRFRVSFEDHSDIYRDIEILSSQSFYDLHEAIQQAIGFDASKNATFYISNDYWRREKEVPLQITRESEDKKGKSKSQKTYLCDFIDDPHQKLIYYFDFDKVENAAWIFTVELIKLTPEDATVLYPRTVKTVGVAIRQYKVQKFAPSNSEEDEDEKPKSKSKKIQVEKIFDEDEFTGAAVLKDDDDLADGFGEEGEDELEDETSFDDSEKTDGEDEDDMLEDSPEDEFEQLDENMEE